MSDILDMLVQDKMTLVALASKACEHVEVIKVALTEAGIRTGADLGQMNATQFAACVAEALPVLARLDEENPGMVPVPHDGRSWADRAKG